MKKNNVGDKVTDKGNRNIILVLLVVGVIAFFYFRNQNNDKENDVLDEEVKIDFDSDGLKAAVYSVQIDNLAWQDFVNHKFQSRNHGNDAASTVKAVMDPIISNKAWVDNLREPAEWAAIDYHEYIVRHAIEQTILKCKIMPRTEEEGNFIVTHERSVNEYFTKGNCNADDFMIPFG